MGAMKLAVVGAGGRMGQTLIRTIAASEAVAVCGAIERPGAAALGRDAGELAGIGPLGVCGCASTPEPRVLGANGASLPSGFTS